MDKALFLDRDGIINIDHGYVSKIEKFEFSEGIFELLQFFMEADYKLFIITNQSGIGRGYYSKEDFSILTSWMLEKLKEKKIIIESIEYCCHAPEEKCSCRKPATGMIENVLMNNKIDLTLSWMIGDKQSDIDLAHNAGIKHTISIGKNEILKSEYSFETVLNCKDYLEMNRDKIR